MRTLAIDDEKEIIEIINSLSLCYIGVTDRDGSPYVLPMNFGINSSTKEIILHSAPEGRLYETLKSNPKACVTFCTKDTLKWQDEHVACSYRSEAKSVVAEGEVEFIEDCDKKVDYLNIIMKNYSDRVFKYNSPAVRNVAVFILKVDSWRAKHFGAAVKSHFK